ncbi:substrate-binding periplasmic protein [Geomonas agri]|uniref:substrate-binding periplasmic protein n=1 Tax=Geomonas agri TaxID=2873702 RepID=UPI001CD7927E|nr:transporter substrate-binding domain-containing protein [Geomonas agri]
MRRWVLLFMVLLITMQAVPAAGAERYRIVVDDWVPYSFLKGGKPAGTDIDLLNAVGKSIGIGFEFVFVPWSRAIQMVKQGEADGIISLYDTPERREFLTYTTTPLSSETIVLIVAARKKLKPITTVADLAGLSVGVTPDTSYGREFDAATGFAREPCMSTDLKISKLLAGRMDVAVINRNSLGARLKQSPELKKKIRVLPLVINEQNLYLAFSKKALEQHRAPVEQISKSLARLRGDGTAARINRAYLSAIK